MDSVKRVLMNVKLAIHSTLLLAIHASMVDIYKGTIVSNVLTHVSAAKQALPSA